jgi:beta-aspartyl-peptidase (threonine type)
MPPTDERPPILRLTWSMIGTFVFVELLFTAVVIAITLLLCVHKEGRAAEPDGVERAVRAVLDKQVADWNAGNLDGFMTGYWKGDNLTFFSGGSVTKGWQATNDRYQKRYKSEGKEMGTLAFSDIAVEGFDANRAMALGRWKLTLKDESNPNGLFTLILRRLDGQWRIVHDHTSAAEKAN